MASSDDFKTSRLGAIASPRTAALAAFAVLAWAVPAGPVWLRAVPDWLTFPVAQAVRHALNWFARSAEIADVTIQELTRGLAAFFDYIIEGTVVVLSQGIFTGRRLNVTQAVPPLSWIAIGGAAVIAS